MTSVETYMKRFDILYSFFGNSDRYQIFGDYVIWKLLNERQIRIHEERLIYYFLHMVIICEDEEDLIRGCNFICFHFDKYSTLIKTIYTFSLDTTQSASLSTNKNITSSDMLVSDTISIKNQ